MCLGTLCDHGDRSHQERRGDKVSAGVLCLLPRGAGSAQGSPSSVTLTATEDLSQLLL